MDTVELAEALTAIPSHGDETAAGEYVERWLTTRTDAVVERDEVGNVIARRNAGVTPSFALVGHHDVVPPDEEQITECGEYVVERRDGRLYGRGTADMKGSLAAAMTAFRDAEPDCELVFASFAGEEAGGVGCRAAIENGFAPDYAIVGEGSTGYSAADVTDVAIAHRGRRGTTVLAGGTAAHASEPAAGENAIYKALDAIGKLRDMGVPEAEVLGHGLEGNVTVTEIGGGSAWNVVPERCSVTVDERTVPGERIDFASIEAIDGVSVRIDDDLPPMACEDAAFADAMRSAAGSAQRETPEHVVKPHSTDAGWLTRLAGTSCVVCGAAEPGEAHTASESVSVEVITRCADIYRRAAESL